MEPERTWEVWRRGAHLAFVPAGYLQIILCWQVEICRCKTTLRAREEALPWWTRKRHRHKLVKTARICISSSNAHAYSKLGTVRCSDTCECKDGAQLECHMKSALKYTKCHCEYDSLMHLETPLTTNAIVCLEWYIQVCEMTMWVSLTALQLGVCFLLHLVLF